jgi:hypothetical protein
MRMKKEINNYLACYYEIGKLHHVADLLFVRFVLCYAIFFRNYNF